MFRIGAFSQLTGVTIKTLRYYDRVGLLQPAEVDRFTGYRTYTLAQMDRLNRILALKDLGLSLDEIGKLLVENPDVAELRGMLRLKRAQIRRSIADEQARLERVEARLRLIESEGALPAHEVVVRDVAALDTLHYREVIAGPWEIKPLIGRVYSAMQTARIEPTGPCVALYYQGEYREHDLDFAIALPVGKDAPDSLPLWDDQCLRRQQLPAMRAASILCHMHTQTDIYLANRDLSAWIVQNGYRVTDGPCREIYPQEQRPGEPLVFEVQLPVTRQ